MTVFDQGDIDFLLIFIIFIAISEEGGVRGKAKAL
jgi:hypothetical protein